MARLPVPGSDDGKWGEILNEYLSVSHDETGLLKPSAVSKTTLGLDNVDNTADVDKPISTAVQTALSAKADSSSLTPITTKLDTIEANADVTDATNVAAAGAVMKSDNTATGINFVVDEDAMTSNSDTKVPTQQSVKAYVDSTRYPTVSTSSSATATLTGANHATTVRYTNNAQVTVTIPTDAANDLPDGFWTMLFAEGAGGLTLSTTGITLTGTNPSVTVGQNEALFVIKTPVANTWMVIGGTQ